MWGFLPTLPVSCHYMNVFLGSGKLCRLKGLATRSWIPFTNHVGKPKQM